MDIWGTRPNGNTESSGKPWTIKEFAFDIHGDSLQPGSAEKNVGNWREENKRPPKNRTTIQKIEAVLFGDNAGFDDWKNDLRLARERSSARARRRVANSAPNHFAAAARENVDLVVSRFTGFVGRYEDINFINQFVDRRMAGGEHGLLVITAPPGTGKSALAAHWCTEAGKAPNRRIAYHFCSLTTGRATTSHENIIANLYRQIADVMGEPIDASASADALTALLSRAPPDDQELVIWLDGMDEAVGTIECFLPMNLGERICLIVSARADKNANPACLVPWLGIEGIATRYNPHRLNLENLPASDVERLVKKVFVAERAAVPRSLARRIFDASRGHALFARLLTEDAAGAVRDGKAIESGGPSESLRGYAQREVRRLETLDSWPIYQPLFAFLTVAEEAVPVRDIPMLIGSDAERFYPESFHPALRRWLSVTAAPNSQAALMSFAHPMLAEIFGEAVSCARLDVARDLCETMLSRPFGQWPHYAIRYLPYHMNSVARNHLQYHDRFVALMTDPDFIAARYKTLKAGDFGIGQSIESLMFDDWLRWIGQDRTGTSDNYHSVPMQHFHHWRNAVREF